MHADIRFFFLMVASVTTAMTLSGGGALLAAGTSKGTGGIMAPPPDIQAAVQAEYDGAVRNGTREAYERFIRRHAKHVLAEKAREALENGDLK